ncbi:MAG: hypothetical protein ACKV22_39225 [Bryobacteraceae bacterium]
MATTNSVDNSGPQFFAPHAHLSDEVNRNIIQSEIEGGVHMKDLPPGSVISIQTRNHLYNMVVLGVETALLSGHPEYCPDPTEVRIHGSTWGGSMIKTEFLGRGMCLEFEHPVYRTILTTRILEIRAHA